MAVHLRGRALRAAAGAALLIAGTVATAAQADTCYELRQEMRQVIADSFGIAADYPKTHTAIAACLMQNGTDNDRVSCAASVVTMSCLGMGLSDCADLTSRWIKTRSDYLAIDAAWRRQGCS